MTSETSLRAYNRQAKIPLGSPSSMARLKLIYFLPPSDVLTYSLRDLSKHLKSSSDEKTAENLPSMPACPSRLGRA